MRMYDIIKKKRDGYSLNSEEINFFIKNYVDGNIPDYQASALLMAIYFKGMNDEETTNLTLAMANSGDTVDLSQISGIKVDKHSTGGVGDKTSLVIAPIVAACGGKVAKLSGRGLGHTGGTLDKIESIPGTSVSISEQQFIDNVNKIGLSIIGQTKNLTPADKKLYALRDVTATVDSIPLIATSIMSKKIASGSDAIVLDVKSGSGAFMKTVNDSISLAKQMVNIGTLAEKNMAAIVTNMDIPLGNAIGNTLEVIEAIETLSGNGPEDLTKICLELASYMLMLSNIGDYDTCYKMAKNSIKNKTALHKLAEMVELQNGDKNYILYPHLFDDAQFVCDVISEKSGFISKMDTEEIGNASSLLGAGRITIDSPVDFTAGIILNKKYGDYVKEGDVICRLYTNNKNSIEEAKNRFINSITISSEKPEEEKLIYAIVTKEQVKIL